MTEAGLAQTIARGGAHMMVRQILGMLIALGGMFALTGMIGPAAYGVYAAALGIYAYAFALSQWGIGVYLIRIRGEAAEDDYHQALTLLLLIGIVAVAAAVAASPQIERWTRLEGTRNVMLALFALLPLNLVALVANARLERRLDYPRIAWIELAAQLSFYAVALPLAWRGAGMWAPVAGWWSYQWCSAILMFLAADYRPRLRWRVARIRPMLGYGLGYGASVWVWQARNLVNPLIVARFAGAEAVGVVALTIRIVEALSFIKRVAWRMSIAAMARLQDDPGRLAAAIAEGMRAQVIALAPALLAFSAASPWLVELAFGRRWLPLVEIYPFIALSYLANALFNMHASALHVVRGNWRVAVFNLVHIALFAGSAWLLVPRLGIIGYGLAEVVALAAYPVIDRQARRAVGAIAYQPSLAWAAGFGLALFWPWLGGWAAAGPLAVLVWPRTWRTLAGYRPLLGGLPRTRRQPIA